ncbi:MAG: right-handed parallel beta-helix repeat-containing protein, partial [Pirellula sp.]
GNYYRLGNLEVIGNRVYANLGAGVSVAGPSSLVASNTIYSNAVGIATMEGYFGTSANILNNLVYDQSSIGISAGGNSVTLTNNTLYQNASLGVLVSASQAMLENNIISQSTGHALRVQRSSQFGFRSDYNAFELTGDVRLADWLGMDLSTLEQWRFETGHDSHSLLADPDWVDPDGADNILGWDNGVDYGGDDRLLVGVDSPTIDAGNPLSFHLVEPFPSGERVNLGHTGNTPQATTSQVRLGQFLNPSHLSKLEVGEETLIGIRTSGMTSTSTVLRMDTSVNGIGEWSGDRYSEGGSFWNAGAQPVDVSGVNFPAPSEVYQSYALAGAGYGDRLSYRLPVPDGSYVIRLHLIEYWATPNRLMNIEVNGVVRMVDYSTYVAAGNRIWKAVVLELPVDATSGDGIVLSLVTKNTIYPAILSGLEVVREDVGGSAIPQVDLEFSENNGANWEVLAIGVALDRDGRATFPWTPSQTTSGNHGMLRMRKSSDGELLGESSNFLIAPAGNHFYVNDASIVNDSYTTAIGSDLNSGKSPSAPMRTLSSMLDAYDFGPGDVIHVDAGVYELARTIKIGPEDAGVRIEGPTTGQALLRRLGKMAGAHVIEVMGSQDVVLKNLSITDGEIGILVKGSSQSVRIENVEMYGNDRGVSSEPNSTGLKIMGSKFHDQRIGVELQGSSFQGPSGLMVSGNEFYRNTTGISGLMRSGVIEQNSFYENQQGLSISAIGAIPIEVRENTAFGNTVGLSIGVG